jgi:hypothetical protein
MSERFFISYLAQYNPDKFFSPIGEAQYSSNYLTCVTDVPVLDFVIHMATSKGVRVVPLYVQGISLSEAAELVSGGAGIPAFYIEEES